MISFVVNKIIYKHEITIGESCAIISVPIVILIIFWGISVSSKTHDSLILNGKVTSKEIDRVHCRHSYQCRCYTSCSGSGKSRSCSRHCSTCYSHLYDIDYVVHSTIGNFYINTLDSQGLITPPRYSSTQISESVSTISSYTNYIKGSKNTIFKDSNNLSKKELKALPKYPLQIYDYWKLDRVIDTTNSLSKETLAEQNLKLSNILQDQEKGKEHNVVIVYLNKSQSYANTIISQWIGGKKNDILIFIGVNSDHTIDYVKIHSWSINSIFDVSLKEDIYDAKTIMNFDKIIEGISTEINQSYLLRNFKEFEYLKWQIIPGNFELGCYILIVLITSFGMSYILGKPQCSTYSSSSCVYTRTYNSNKQF